jgi:hypothetical protein
MMVTFGVLIKEQGRKTKEGRTWKMRRVREFYGSKVDKEGEHPQGAKSLHLGGLVLP